MNSNDTSIGNAGCHQSIITVDDVSFFYENKQVIEHLNFTVLERDFVGLIGSNGAGKTTLLKMIVGLLKPSQGEIRLFGQPLRTFRDWERIGYVPQKNSLNPLFPATVREIVLSGLYGKKNMFRRISKAEQQKCEDALYAMRIEDLASRRIGQLSGGQQQRVFLARALINNPQLLILDEPTVGIDAETQAGFFRMIRHMHQHHHITFLLVSHDMDMVQSYIGNEPAQKSGALSFYVKHTHEPENCKETNLTHSIQQLREQMEVLV
ncbi:ATP-binding cassette domain-containing protein [Paenibacillus sp. LMG 31456]|uniref:ATP-binding cassette domain-containing protein n=1 Tax=Paenibacillus foliorum TaxID=2654974 RepID=A0A972H0B6_9BACL|nr:metal ABC transporter ATP-binding protein [Paenibacillus foliorum]NOU97082.1 ATP-binding cassette domain-containing protein [Paenibacillus foliorum]